MALQQDSKRLRRAISGVVLLDKPVGLTSTQALGRVKWLMAAQKGGHTGTLDPFASGLLPLCLGEATKFSRFMLDADKTYIATLRLGSRTPTGDTESAPFEARRIEVDEHKVNAVLQSFLGEQQQTPPMHSAIKQGGQPLYKLARQGIEVPREARDIRVHSLNMVALEPAQLVVEARVSKGTYLRVLAEDIGEALGCGAHLCALQRTETGGLQLSQSIRLDQLEQLTQPQRDALLLPVDALCLDLPEMILPKTDATVFKHGGVIHTGLPEAGERRVYGEDRAFLGIGAISGKKLVPVRLMS